MKKITSYPILLGILIAILIGCVIIVATTWFPWLGEALGRHKRLVQGIYFTVFFFCIWVYMLWGRHRRPMFWTSFFILILLHVVGVSLFTFHFRPLFVWEWTLLGIVESFIVATFVYLLTRHSGGSRGKPGDRPDVTMLA